MNVNPESNRLSEAPAALDGARPAEPPGPQTVWRCKIGNLAILNLPDGADAPMRRAINAAFYDLTGQYAQFIFSGWGSYLTEGELAVVQDREPAALPSPGGEPNG